MTQAQTPSVDSDRGHRHLLRGRGSRLQEAVEVVTLPLAQVRDMVRAFVVSHLATRAEALLAPVSVWVFFLLWAGQGLRDSIGWWGYGVLVAVTAPTFAVLFTAAGRRLTWRRIPLGVSAFALVTCLSVLWSQYKLMTVAAGGAMVLTTLSGVLMAVAFPLREMMGFLTRALQWTIGLSLALEVFVAAVLGHRLAPLYMLGSSHVADTAYWVNGLIFQGGPIQGIVGNRNPLAFIALMCALCVVVTWLDHRMSTAKALFWLGMSLLTLGLTRSATVMLAALACTAVIVTALLIRSLDPGRRRGAVRIAVAVAVVVLVTGLLLHDSVSEMLGRAPDMSGRSEIWERVLRLWELRPVTGWGWTMYWAPWIPMFRYLVVRGDGAPTMSAHNAFLEALFQTGLIGLVVLVVVIALLVRRTFSVALRNLDTDIMTLLPALAMTAMVIQAFTESRLISEGNWMLVAAIATWLSVRALPSQSATPVEEPSDARPEVDADQLVGSLR